MSPVVRVILAACVVAAALSPSRAQDTPSGEAARAVSGSWEMSNADRDRVCVITLKNDKAGSGLRLELEPKCPETFQFLRPATAWMIGSRDAIRLIDAKAQPVIEFSEVESGMYEAERPGEGLLFLQNVNGAPSEKS